MNNKEKINYIQKYIYKINIPVMKIESIEEEKAVLSMDVNEDMCNVYGILHGGALYSLADTACGVHCTVRGNSPVTLNSSFNFLKPCEKDEKKIYAISHVKHMGRSTQVIDVDVMNKEGKIFASCTFTMFSSNYSEKREVNDE